MPCLYNSPERKSTSKAPRRVPRVLTGAVMADVRVWRQSTTNYCGQKQDVTDRTHVPRNIPEFKELHDQNQNRRRPCRCHCAWSTLGVFRWSRASQHCGEICDRLSHTRRIERTVHYAAAASVFVRGKRMAKEVGMRRMRNSRSLVAVVLVGLAVALVGCGGSQASPTPPTPVTPNASITGQYNLVLSSSNGHGATNIYTNFTQTGTTFTGGANTLVCPSNDLSECEGDNAPVVSITPSGNVNGANVTMTISFPSTAGADTVTMIGTATGTGLTGTYTDSLGDTGTWSASAGNSLSGNYGGTFHSNS